VQSSESFREKKPLIGRRPKVTPGAGRKETGQLVGFKQVVEGPTKGGKFPPTLKDPGGNTEKTSTRT